MFLVTIIELPTRSSSEAVAHKSRETLSNGQHTKLATFGPDRPHISSEKHQAIPPLEGLALSADFAMQNRLSGNVDFAQAKSTGSVAQVVRAHA